MKKEKYSLTAKERKDKRNNIPKTQARMTPHEKTEVKEINKSKNMKVILAVLMALLVAILAFFVPVLINYNVNPYQGVFSKEYITDNPIAKMRLSNGMVIKYEIFEETCPVAASNFIYLARKKFFDNTIIFDIQNNWVRFGGYESANLHRENNKKYVDSFTGISKEHEDNKFGYRLYADSSSDAGRITEAGMLTFLYSDSATEFQISAIAGAQTTLQKQDGTSRNYKPTAFGSVLNVESMNNIKAIANLPMTESYLDISKPWKGPYDVIKVESVKIYNLKKDKWKKFAFEDYMNTARDGSSAIQYWTKYNN